MPETPSDDAPEVLTAELKANRKPIGRVLVTGASGFLGRSVCSALVQSGYQVTGLVRREPKPDGVHNGIDYQVGDVTDASSLNAEVFEGIDAVIHLVGIIVERRGTGETFQAVHVRGTANVCHAAVKAGTVDKFVYVSALGASFASESEYSQTKARAENIAESSEIPFTIFRPSIILGKSGDFVRQIEDLIKRPPLSPIPLPFIPVPGSGKNLFQPVFIDDLVECIVRSLASRETDGQTYEIGGASQVSFNALIEAFSTRLNIRKRLVHIPEPFLFFAASILEALLPSPPITVDQLINLRVDSVCDNGPATAALGVSPRGFEQALELI